MGISAKRIRDFVNVLAQLEGEPIPQMMETMIHGDGSVVELLLRTPETPIIRDVVKLRKKGYRAVERKIKLYNLYFHTDSETLTQPSRITRFPKNSLRDGKVC